MLATFFALVTLEPVVSGTLADLRRLLNDAMVAGVERDAGLALSL